MEKVVKLFNMGESPDDIEIRHIGTDIHILVKGRYMYLEFMTIFREIRTILESSLIS